MSLCILAEGVCETQFQARTLNGLALEKVCVLPLWNMIHELGVVPGVHRQVVATIRMTAQDGARIMIEG